MRFSAPIILSHSRYCMFSLGLNEVKHATFSNICVQILEHKKTFLSDPKI